MNDFSLQYPSGVLALPPFPPFFPLSLFRLSFLLLFRTPAPILWDDHWLGGEARRALCRELRQRQTPAEEFLWELVRDRRFEGYKFRRQHPLGRFIADFYCPELCLAVELDGGIHAMQVERDRARDEILAQHDIRVVRIRNEGFLHAPEATLAQLSDLIAHWTTHDQRVSAPPPTPPDAQA